MADAASPIEPPKTTAPIQPAIKQAKNEVAKVTETKEDNGPITKTTIVDHDSASSTATTSPALAPVAKKDMKHDEAPVKVEAAKTTVKTEVVKTPTKTEVTKKRIVEKPAKQTIVTAPVVKKVKPVRSSSSSLSTHSSKSHKTIVEVPAKPVEEPVKIVVKHVDKVEEPSKSTVQVVQHPVTKQHSMVVHVPLAEDHPIVAAAKPITTVDSSPAKRTPRPMIRHPHLGPLLYKVLRILGKSEEKAMARLIKWRLYELV